MKKSARSFAAIVGVIAVAAASLSAAAGAATGTHGVKDSGTSYASVVHQSGKTLYAAGYTFDKHFGQIAITYVTTVAPGTTGTVDINVKKVTLYAPKGTLYGTASAVQNLATGAVSSGKINLTHGTGGLAGHAFKGTFNGTYDATTSVYTFKYVGTLK